MDSLLQQSTRQRTRRQVPLPMQQRVSNICESFKKADGDGNGTIDADEFARLIKALNPAITPETSKRLFEEADINGDGRLVFSEFMEWMFSDLDEAEATLCEAVGGKSKLTGPGLKRESADSAASVDVESEIIRSFGFSNAYRSFIATYPQCAAAADKYIKEQTQRFTSPEYVERISKSFGTRLDKDGNGLLSYNEVKDLIRDVLQAEDSGGRSVQPDEAQIREFFNSHCTEAFGRQMGSNQFLDLMRSLNIHMMGKNLVLLQERWKEEAGQESMTATGLEKRG